MRCEIRKSMRACERPRMSTPIFGLHIFIKFKIYNFISIIFMSPTPVQSVFKKEDAFAIE